MKKLLKKVGSLADLAMKARTDDRYARLAAVAAENLGGKRNASLAENIRWLSLNASEIGEENGVVAEVNFVRDLV